MELHIPKPHHPYILSNGRPQAPPFNPNQLDTLLSAADLLPPLPLPNRAPTLAHRAALPHLPSFTTCPL